MDKLKIIKILSFIVMITSVLVTVGWILDIGVLKSILPGMVTMKFTTALCFGATAFILNSMAQKSDELPPGIQMVLPAATLFILLIMSTLLISSFTGVNSGIDSLLIQEKAGTVNTVTPGRPSVATMINFILITIASILVHIDLAKYKKIFIWLGTAVAFIGALAVSGYIFHLPFLYFYVPNISTAMALSTAILFVLTGIGFILCGKNPSKQN